ncbi:MAG: putative DNA binding domain-containing protein [Deltaproteobacteria bacterium]|nr:putative DNA binding domain-containing protein [Deltaproteobacteria bacterium]
MDNNSSRAQEIIERPNESLSVELKRWIDPDTQEGIAKIVKTTLALRNHGGGYLVIGINNKTLAPDIENIPENLKEKFHIDKIQGLISKFASDPFEVLLEFPEKAGQEYPVIIVPSGVRTPVATKSELDFKGRKLIKTDMIYVRSLRANNTPSTTQASWKDWPKIVEVCFDNREADIGRFLRRHLGAIKPEIIGEFAAAVIKKNKPEPTNEDLLRRFLQESEKRFASIILERKLQLPDHGVWEVALIFVGTVPPHAANREFLNLLDSNNPDYTGWPVWLDSRAFKDQDSRPFVIDGVWEAMILSLETGWNDYDFLRFDPKGRFYIRRALQDDISKSQRAPEPLKALDFGLPIIRCAEAIAVGISFAKAMGCDAESTQLSYAFKWSRLRGRKLVSWANPERYISAWRSAYQDEVLSFINVPLETPLSALGDYVNKVVQPLFEIFDGFILSTDVIEDLTQRLIQRKLF